MGLLFAFAVMLAAPQGDALKNVVPVAGVAYRDYGKERPFLPRDPSRCYCLRGDYGFLIKWDEKNPPEFHIYQKNPARTACLATFEELLDWIRKVPEGAEISWINFCCASICYAMPAEKYKQLCTALKPKAPTEKQDESHEVFCTCMDGGVVTIFKTLEEGRNWIREHKDCKDAYTDKPLSPDSAK